MTKKTFAIGLLVAIALLVPGMAFAQEGAKSSGGIFGEKFGHLSAALVLGVAAAAGAISQARTAVAACEGMARNPGASAQIRAMAFLGLVLIESLVIYALVIAFVINSK